jgi:pimeloyl-ACP methyl ester carboxylesterase
MSVRERERLSVSPADGVTLQGELSYDSAIGPAAVVFLHGFGSTCKGEKATALEAECARRGWSFATFDLRGHGESSGTMHDLRGTTMLEDIQHIDAALAIRGIDRLFLIGSSMGGWLTAWFARTHPERVVAAGVIAPAFTFPHALWEGLDEELRADWKTTGRLAVFNEGRRRQEELSYRLMEDAERYRVEDLARDWSTPLLIFHGMQDDVVPYAESVQFVQHAGPVVPMELRLLNPGDHRLVDYKEEMASAFCRFFERRSASRA